MYRMFWGLSESVKCFLIFYFQFLMPYLFDASLSTLLSSPVAMYDMTFTLRTGLSWSLSFRLVPDAGAKEKECLTTPIFE